MKNSEMLFKDVFEEVDLEDIDEIKGGLSKEHCSQMLLACYSELWGCGGRGGSCSLYEQFCGKLWQ